MIKIIFSLALLALISGCSIHQSFGDSFGSGVREPKGDAFKEVGPRWDQKNTALLYVYRPASRWSLDELEAPSFNVNDKRLFNIKGGSYTWYEMRPGHFDVVMRRGLLGFEGVNSLIIKKVAEFSLDAKPGEVYYLRYSEINKLADGNEPAFIGSGPLQLVNAEQALPELAKTRMLHKGRLLLEARKPVADKDLEQVFDGQLKPTKSATQAKTKEEGWWPF